METPSAFELVQYAQQIEWEEVAPAAAGTGALLQSVRGQTDDSDCDSSSSSRSLRRQDHLHVFLRHRGVKADVHLCKTTREGEKRRRFGRQAPESEVTAVAIPIRPPAMGQRQPGRKMALLTPPSRAVRHAFAATLLSMHLALAGTGKDGTYAVSAAEHMAYAGWFLARQQREQQERRRRREQQLAGQGGTAAFSSSLPLDAAGSAAEQQRQIRGSASGRRSRAHFRAALEIVCAEDAAAEHADAAETGGDGGDNMHAAAPLGAPELRKLANTAGIVFAAAGLHADAVGAFSLAAHRDPAHPTARYNLACALAEQGVGGGDGGADSGGWDARRWAEELAARRAVVLRELRAAWDARCALLQKQERAMLEGQGDGRPEGGGARQQLLRVPELPNPLEDECFRVYWGDPELQELAQLFVQEHI